MEKEEKQKIPLVRVVKGNWRTKETMFLSEPMIIKKAMALIKEMVPSLPTREEDTLLVKFVEDQGQSFDYMSCGGWLIFTHCERVPW